MKKQYIILSAAAALAAASPMLNAQTAASKPVGVRTETLIPGFNLVSANLLNSTSISGDIESISGNVISETDSDLSVSLVAANKYFIVITSGSNAGINTEITSFTSNSITTLDNISSLVVANDKYEIRKASTLADLFGSTNTAGLLAGTATTADIVWIPTGVGSFDRFYYTNAGAGGWRKVGVLGTADQSSNINFYTDAIFIEKKGISNLIITFTGHVNPTAPKIAVQTGFNLVSTYLPINTTLEQTALKSQLLTGSATTADKVWVPNGTGGYDRYYVNNTAGVLAWRKVGVLGTADQGANLVKSGVILERLGANLQLSLTQPSGLDI